MFVMILLFMSLALNIDIPRRIDINFTINGIVLENL